MSILPNPLDRQNSGESRAPLQQGGRVLSLIGDREGLRALRAFAGLHEILRDATFSSDSGSEWIDTERFMLQEVLYLICSRAQELTRADAVLVALFEGGELICRAGAGTHAVPPGTRLNLESRFLQECLESGKTLLSDEAGSDPEVEHDFARQIGAGSTVVVPLRGRRERIGVLQAFSAEPGAFTEWNARALDLFGELILGALKPKDQDRRQRWLTDTETEFANDRIGRPSEKMPSDKSGVSSPAEPAAVQIGGSTPLSAEANASEQRQSRQKNGSGEPGFLHEVLWPLTSRPGLSAVVAMVMVAGLFSAGVWWGMQVDTHNRAKNGAMKNAAPSPVAGGQPSASVAAQAGDLAAASGAGAASDGVLSAVPESKLAELPKITSVRHWSSPGGSTVVIDMDDQVNYEVHRLMSPDRIYFDLHDTALPPDLEGKTMEVGDASLASVRVAQPVAGVTRVVLDTKDGSNFSVSMETNPYRLVIELHEGAKTLSAGRVAAVPAPLTAKVSRPELALPPRSSKFRVVLDAGHGGWDLGTVGRQGLLEKDLVLDVAQRLGKLLQARIGAEVMFTRTADDYVALDERADFANQAQADLFVSVHANYSNAATARGVETYYTDLFSAPGLKEMEKQSNAIPLPAPVALSAPELREKTEESRRLAASVQRSLYATLAANNPNIRDRGIKDASFVVLTGTTMPSILTEISFVSSPADEHNLQSEAYRQQIAEALYKGIARYEEASPHTKVAQLHTGASSR
ncbi:MAG: N-acetylmuramoyl-L-alanine amidase [Terriglobales bacterium]